MSDPQESSAPSGAPPAPPPQLVRARSPWTRRPLPLCALAGLLFCIAAALLALGTGYGYRKVDASFSASHLAPPPPELASPDAPEVVRKSEKALGRLLPKGPYILIDRVQNRLRLVEEGKVTLDAVISAGAGSVLEDPSGKRKWVFDTPVGRFKVKGRREDPVWTAPDWEYIESGEPFPKRYSDRVQEGMLGEYALDLDVPGYMIHGTLYTRLLGRNVSHGCIRVGRDDLRILWKKCPIGTSVFIY